MDAHLQEKISSLGKCSWREFFELLYNVFKKIKSNDDTFSTITTTIKKADFINNILNSLDLELIPTNILDDFINNFKLNSDLLLQNIKQYDNEKNINFSNGINDKIDIIISLICSNNVAIFLNNSKISLRSKKQEAVNINESFSKIKEQVRENLLTIEDKKNQIDKITEELIKSRDRINKLEHELFEGDDENISAQAKIDESMLKIIHIQEEIEVYYDKLKKGNEKESSIILQIDNAQKTAIEYAGRAKDQVDQAKEITKELIKFHDKIFGDKNSNASNNDGLEKHLETKMKDLDAITTKHKEAYNQLILKIESLLPGATSAGLSEAFSEMSKKFKLSIISYTILFIVTICLISGFGIYEINIALTKANENNNLIFVNSILLKLPVFISLIWLAIFLSKRRSEDRRLQQEYAHKQF